jgi:CubicO group peptidase (beta-lactamase class C family)
MPLLRPHWSALLLGLAVATPLAIAQQALPGPLAGGPPSDVPIAVQIARWHMNDGDLASFTFRSMDRLFTTRTVARSGAVWMLPHADHPLDVSYSFQGKRFSSGEFLERTYTNALLVMKDGRIVSEIYRNGTDAQSRFIAWSMTKSVTSVLIGCALSEGKIDSLESPISKYLPELKGSGYEGVSIRQVMQMRSGVDYEERYDFEHPGRAATNHISSLVKNVSRFAEMARTLPRIHEPGSVFQYKTIDTAVLGWLVERATGGGVAAYTAHCLWEPLGAESDAFYIMDGPPGIGREFSGAGFNATLRDFARFGQMMLDGGVAAGRRIVSAEWVRESTRPSGSSGGPRSGYGLQWWTLGGNAYAAIGLQGQYVYVDPDTRTVVVKLSYFPPGDNTALDAETQAFLAAVSAWKPR